MKPIQITLSFFLMAQMASAQVGSTYKEVLRVLKTDPVITDSVVAREVSAYAGGGLPQYPMNMGSLFQKKGQLEADAQRTTTDKSDYYPRLEKLLHPNGVCFAGTWKVDAGTPYTGAFRSQTEMLFLGRISAAMEDTVYDSRRGFGFAGKLFPTKKENERVMTQNFFSVDVLLGRKKQRLLDSEMTNNPSTGLGFSTLKFATMAAKIDAALKTADVNPLFRPVKNIASLGENGPLMAPQFVKFSFAQDTVKNTQDDFRREFIEAFWKNKSLRFDVSVAEGDSIQSATWSKIGQIHVKEVISSYGCDRRLHFAHPKSNEF